MNKKSIKKITIGLLIVLSLMLIKYYWLINSPVDITNNKNIAFSIESGQSVKEIAKNLENQDLIRSELAFYWQVKSKKLGPEIFAGSFSLNKSMNTNEILEKIIQPNQTELSFTIQEGLRIRDIDQKLANKNLISPGQFISAIKEFNQWNKYTFLKPNSLDLPLEGYIYPDTYFLDPINFTPEQLIIKALNNFQKKISGIQFSNNKRNIEEIIIMASIIENEVFGFENKKIVSGILWKRLEHDWTIGADATLLYITKDRIITSKDLAIESPYNTRKNLGLPPGPISNPSIESINAALNPIESPYWFYLTTPDTGEVIYSKSNEEHNKNRFKYL